MSEVMKTENPFAGGGAAIVQPLSGLVSVEQQRAIAEIQGRIMMARMSPRDPRKCVDLILNDCQRTSLAEDACYAYSRGGSDVSGPSIRLAEAIARRWGNIAAGIKELARGNGYSDVVAYAWDLETGYYDERLFQVRHWRDTKRGGYALEDERDIYELIANMGQRRKRAVLLSVIPGDVVDAAVRQCELTLKSKADTSPEALAKMVSLFGEFGVTKEQIEQRIQRHLESIQPAQMVSLRRIYTSLRDGISVPSDWFEAGLQAEAPPRTAAPGSAANAVRTAAAAAAGSAPPAITDGTTDQAMRTVPESTEGAARQQQRRTPRAKEDPPPAARPEFDPPPPPVSAAPPAPSLLEKFATLLDRAENAADAETAYLLLDEARSLMKEMSDANQAAAAESLDAAVAALKARSAE